MVIVDHFSRKAVGFAVFREQPTSKDVTAVLDNAVERAGKAPKYIISDKGRQFFCNHYKGWCTDNSIKPRFGAVGKHGSIAITERFIKSLKYECTNLISVPLTLDDMRHEVALYFIWYNQYRPHEYLDARTPEEVYNHSPPIEKNIHKRGSEIPKLELELSFLDGRKHLPIIEFKKAS
jgi:putative transposase